MLVAPTKAKKLQNNPQRIYSIPRAKNNAPHFLDVSDLKSNKSIGFYTAETGLVEGSNRKASMGSEDLP